MKLQCGIFMFCLYQYKTSLRSLSCTFNLIPHEVPTHWCRINTNKTSVFMYYQNENGETPYNKPFGRNCREFQIWALFSGGLHPSEFSEIRKEQNSLKKCTVAYQNWSTRKETKCIHLNLFIIYLLREVSQRGSFSSAGTPW